MVQSLQVSVNAAKEIAEISSDFTNPIEVIRESVHNSFDAGAMSVSIAALPQTLPDKRRVLSLEFVDDGIGMSKEDLERFFGLGFSEKPAIPNRFPIGFKGHGTKIYYQATDLMVVSRVKGGELCLSRLPEARRTVNEKRLPEPEFYQGSDAEALAKQLGLALPGEHGTVVRLVDYTADSSRLIDTFRFMDLDNYLRWFTVYGSFSHIVTNTTPNAPFELLVRGTDASVFQRVDFGHLWPTQDLTELKHLKRLDDRRPFNYFSKSFRFPAHAIEDGYRIDVAMLFEGRRGRLDRDKGISRQRVGGLYSEEERYGLWLCRDFIPVERRFEWLLDEDCPRIVEDLRRPLILVNSQDLMLIANRGSVGNSSPQLLGAIKRAVYGLLEQVQDDKDVERFLNEYQEDLFSRKREKDQKALMRRIDRFNAKRSCKVTLSTGQEHEFFEPKREITLFGLISELQVLDPAVLDLEILDYDDHSGIDMLVRKNGNPADLLDRTKVAYVELKYLLGAQLNHAFDHLFAIICWETEVSPSDFVTDATNNKFQYEESKSADGVTLSRLVPLADSRISHNVRVIVLRRLLEEKYNMASVPNPKQVSRTTK